jgi:hypothetical protein
MRYKSALLVLCTIAAFSAAPALAQTFPWKTIRVVDPTDAVETSGSNYVGAGTDQFSACLREKGARRTAIAERSLK